MVLHSDDAFAPVAYLSFKKMSLQDKPVVRIVLFCAWGCVSRNVSPKEFNHIEFTIHYLPTFLNGMAFKLVSHYISHWNSFEVFVRIFFPIYYFKIHFVTVVVFTPSNNGSFQKWKPELNTAIKEDATFDICYW